MSVCRVRLLLWLILVFISIVGGVVTDLVMGTEPFPILVRALGLVGIILTYFPLKRTGRLLKLLGDSEKWGCTNRLVTTDLYRCVRHPHHLSVGIFMTSLGLLIGHMWSFLIITVIQWLWVLGFLFLVEEPELVKKFGMQYKTYRKQAPMLFPKPVCAFRVLTKPLSEGQGESAERGA